MNNSEFLTPSEAAKYLKVCKATIYKLINTRKLPAVKVGRVIRIAKSNIDKISVSD